MKRKCLQGGEPVAASAKNNDTADESNLDYHRALRSVLSKAGLTERQLEEALEQIDARRAPGGKHLSLDEVDVYAELPEARQKHVDECRFCADLLHCVLSPEALTHLAHRAAEAAARESRGPLRTSRHLAKAAAFACVLVLTALVAVAVGRSSSRNSPHKASVARYVEELGALGAQKDRGTEFRVARIYSELDLPVQARRQFLIALRRENVGDEVLESFEALTREANDASLLGRASAWLRLSLTRHAADTALSAEQCLALAKLQLTAGDSTAAYSSFLRYLALINAKPPASEEYDDATIVALSSTRES